MKTLVYLVPIILSLLLTSSGYGQSNAQCQFTAQLSAATNGPRPVHTDASGQATFTQLEDGTLQYTLNVKNIKNVYMAHLHLAQGPGYGPMVAWLYPPRHEQKATALEGPFTGTLCEETLHATDLIGELAGQDIDNLIEAMEAGKTYIVVHTSQYRSGELYGMVR